MQLNRFVRWIPRGRGTKAHFVNRDCAEDLASSDESIAKRLISVLHSTRRVSRKARPQATLDVLRLSIVRGELVAQGSESGGVEELTTSEDE